MIRKMPIRECQPGLFDRPTDEYTFHGLDTASGLYLFVTQSGQRELFVRRTTRCAGWHLERGAFFFEFCRGGD